ncbi:MAG: hypothetical protein SGI87_03325 [Flavobacteriales bacterium]|nr:hypothetical protein [Flavobacteriales bacterium]
MLVLSIIAFRIFGDRIQFLSILAPLTFAFGGYLLILYRNFLNFNTLIVSSCALRLIFLCSQPILSNDFSRFLWDGTLTAESAQLTYRYTPTEALERGILPEKLDTNLLQELNSPTYYSVYPPVCQWIWSVSAQLSGGSINAFIEILRVWMILFDLGTIILISLILRSLGKSQMLASVYALNPLVITEISGNLHPEGIMLFFVALSFYLLFRNVFFAELKKRSLNFSFVISALCFGLAIATKLIPLMLLPLFIPLLGWKRSIVFGLIAIAICLACFYPFVTWVVYQNISSSLDLYFRDFEFNASFYYLAREAAYLIRGFNEIDYLGPFLAVVTISYVFFSSIMPRFRQPFFSSLLIAATIHLLFSTTIHPWYLLLPIFLGVFAEKKFAIYWSFLVLLSYSHYHEHIWTEQYPLVFIEYFLLITFIILEFSAFRSKSVRV